MDTKTLDNLYDLPREEYLEICKKRALEYLDDGEIEKSFASICSDLSKNPKTQKHPCMQVGIMLLMSGKIDNYDEMKKFIEGFK